MKKTRAAVKSAAKTKDKTPSIPASSPLETASGLEELFTDGIKDMYWAENHLVKSIPKMISAAGSPDLQSALSDHLEVTVEHASRLEQVLDLLGEKIQAKKCDAAEGLVLSGEHVIENTIAGTPARDTGITMSALKVENFEITCYEGLIQLAELLGKSDIAEILRSSLNDEIEADQLLTSLSQEQLNSSFPAETTETNP